jgi:hypothetical protein
MDFLKPIIDSDRGTKKDFTSERKSAVYLRNAINTAPKCGICGARVHIRSISIDHVQAKHDGGVATVDNGQLSHPFCNLVKDQLAQEQGIGVPEGFAIVDPPSDLVD